MSTLDLGVVGNGTFGALIDERGRVVWSCLPRFDGDPVFHDLLNGGGSPKEIDGLRRGFWEIELVGSVRTEQAYIENTAVLTTRHFDASGGVIEIVDFAPRFRARGRVFRPMTLVRRVRPLGGTPRIVVRLRPAFSWGSQAPALTFGSNHLRFIGDDLILRATTNAPVSYLHEEQAFVLHEPVTFILGPDETLTTGIEVTARDWEERTIDWWRSWVRGLAVPLDWQDAVIRAAITLKLCTFEETGATVAAMTTSIPEAPSSGRNWDYRYCWLRDAYFTVRGLNALAEVETMEHYLRYVTDLVVGADGGHLQPVFGVTGGRELVEREIVSLSGYRGMGPVRVGNQAYEHFQHDVYGNVILAATQWFFDQRLFRRGHVGDFERLEQVGEQAWRVHDQPDAGMWELRTRARVHTSSSLMCWAACDRLGRIATHLGLKKRGAHWANRARQIHETICRRAWNAELGAFAESFEGDKLDASLLLMAEVNFLPADDPRFVSTLAAIERTLVRDGHVFRYAEADDFGVPHTAFNICTFWYIDALARTGRQDEARAIFETMLEARNPLGILSEDLDVKTGELWGNYPQTYSLVGIIQAAMRLSRRWGKEL